MIPDPQDTIVALSTPPGPGGRAVVRATGPGSFDLIGAVAWGTFPTCRARRARYPLPLRLPGLTSPMPADIYVWPAPRTYTGQDLVEFHMISSPPIVELLIAQLLRSGARSAEPGEFTLRAFLAGKLDLTQAEAVLAVIHASGRDELQQALAQLAGGIAEPLRTLSEELLIFLADIEAGLDFAEEGIQFVNRDELARRVDAALAQLQRLRTQLDARSLADRPFRAVLVGKPNAGKSSLFNRLSGGGALVSAQPGTTRDFLLARLNLGDVRIDLVDTAGWNASVEGIERRAQALAREQSEQADLLIVCREAAQPVDQDEHLPWAGQRPTATVVVATKCDLVAPRTGQLATSAVTGAGMDDLRHFLAEAARKQMASGLAPSSSRCRHHLDACLEHLTEARLLIEKNDAPELLALELRESVDTIGAMVGAVYTDDLLDRIFSRFCIGK